MSLLTDSQLLAIRNVGVKGMGVDVVITRANAIDTADESNPFGAAEGTFATNTTTVKGWLVSNMGRTFDEDGERIVAVSDYTLRVPVGTAIDVRDKVTIASTDYTVVETNLEDTWPEWTECYIKKVV